jgi:hypothetical protein
VILFPSQRVALAAAVILTAAAGLAWHDAYETRGRRRPMWTKLAGIAL